MEQQQLNMNLKYKLQQCQLDMNNWKDHCTAPSDGSSTAVVQPRNTGNLRDDLEYSEFGGFEKTIGKCRLPGTSNSYTRTDVYNVKNTKYTVTTEKGCAERCSLEQECKAF